MPLTTRSGLTVDLVRPKFEGPRQRKDQPSRRKPRELTASNFILPKVRFANGRSEYKCKKTQSTFFFPPLVLVALRNQMGTSSKFPSDFMTEVLLLYLDEKYTGWDAAVDPVVSLGRALGKEYKGSKVGPRVNYKYGRYLRTPSHIRGPKIEQQYKIPESIYVTIRSIAKVRKQTMSDIVTEATMYFLDETEPGWEAAGDE